MNRLKLLTYILLLVPALAWSQYSNDGIMPEGDIVDYKAPKTYIIAGLDIQGVKFLDKSIIKSISGLYLNQKVDIPGEDITKAIKQLWKQGLFTDIKIVADKVEGDKIYLTIHLIEKSRLSAILYKGIKKGQADDLNKKLDNYKGRPLSEALKNTISNTIKDFYSEKGFLKTQVGFTEIKDSNAINTATLLVNIDKGYKVKINNITVVGNDVVSDAELLKAMKETKEKTKFQLFLPKDKNVFKKQQFKNTIYSLANLNSNSVKTFFQERVHIGIFHPSKFNEDKYEIDKRSIIDYYNTKGYRDATLVSDTIVNAFNDRDIDIYIYVNEGKKYYFRNITFKGNAKYKSEYLEKVLGIKKGDVYNTQQLNTRLKMDPNNTDVSTLYYDDGYLFFNAVPKETTVIGDSIDVEIRINEGPQATIKNIIIRGNDKTNEHVIRRELRTIPGQKFSRTDLIRSQREIANLGYFDAQATQVNPIPNAKDGTVDIEYVVAEKSADQIELSAGWGGSQGLFGTVGLSFNNFSIKNIAKKGAWSPLPTGDGQKLSLRIQSNGKRYQTYNFSFTEPWLGGKKPNALSVSAFRTRYSITNSDGSNGVQLSNGMSLGLGTRLKWPDDYFIFQGSLNYQNYLLKNLGQRIFSENANITNGNFNNLNLKLVLSRSSVSDPMYPTSGSNITLSGQFTPPYSIFRKDGFYTDSSLTLEKKYKFIEYHKWRFNIEWYQYIDKKQKLVIKFAAKMGFLGHYNKLAGLSPFERFQVGGNGLSGANFQLFGNDIIAHRGYGIYSDNGGDAIFNKFTLELRYPFTRSPQATIYGHFFAEAGNSWRTFKDYNPFKLYKSAGIGIRAFLPMFGLIGFDYGIRFDNAGYSDPDNVLNTTNGFLNYIGKNGTFNFILGFEPD